jgi:hypothetical protein
VVEGKLKVAAELEKLQNQEAEPSCKGGKSTEKWPARNEERVVARNLFCLLPQLSRRRFISSRILYRMKVTSAFLSLAAIFATAASASDVLDLTSSTFNDAVAGPLALVEFFAPW